jgi:hypothetical protein
VILGDVSADLNASPALRDFVYECNAGHQIWLVTSLRNLIESCWHRSECVTPSASLLRAC